MNEIPQPIACKNCEATLGEAALYCSSCGQKVIYERYTLKRILSQTLSIITNLDKGFWFTIKELFIHPEQVIRDYLICTIFSKSI